MRDLHFSYDQEGDVLYIAFDKGRKGSSVSLNDNVILRFDAETQEAVGLTLLDFSRLARLDEPLPLVRLSELPPALRDMVWIILNRPPVNLYLRVTHQVPASVVSIPRQVSLAELLMAA